MCYTCNSLTYIVFSVKCTVGNPRLEAGMKVVDRLRRSIAQRNDRVILRSELMGMCSPSQLTNALTYLINEGSLMRVSSGVYSKGKMSSENSALSPSGVQDIAEEVFKKLGRTIKSVWTESDQSHAVVVIDGGSHRLSRKFKIGHIKIEYSSPKTTTQAFINLPDDLDALPKKNVSDFVHRLARSRHVIFKRSGLDEWAEAVTRAAGDDVKLDETGKLLVILKKKHFINGRQMARLMANHLRESQRA